MDRERFGNIEIKKMHLIEGCLFYTIGGDLTNEDTNDGDITIEEFENKLDENNINCIKLYINEERIVYRQANDKEGEQEIEKGSNEFSKLCLKLFEYSKEFVMPNSTDNYGLPTILIKEYAKRQNGGNPVNYIEADIDEAPDGGVRPPICIRNVECNKSTTQRTVNFFTSLIPVDKPFDGYILGTPTHVSSLIIKNNGIFYLFDTTGHTHQMQQKQTQQILKSQAPAPQDLKLNVPILQALVLQDLKKQIQQPQVQLQQQLQVQQDLKLQLQIQQLQIQQLQIQQDLKLQLQIQQLRIQQLQIQQDIEPQAPVLQDLKKQIQQLQVRQTQQAQILEVLKLQLQVQQLQVQQDLKLQLQVQQDIEPQAPVPQVSVLQDIKKQIQQLQVRQTQQAQILEVLKLQLQIQQLQVQQTQVQQLQIQQAKIQQDIESQVPVVRVQKVQLQIQQLQIRQLQIQQDIKKQITQQIQLQQQLQIQTRQAKILQDLKEQIRQPQIQTQPDLKLKVLKLQVPVLQVLKKQMQQIQQSQEQQSKVQHYISELTFNEEIPSLLNELNTTAQLKSEIKIRPILLNPFGLDYQNSSSACGIWTSIALITILTDKDINKSIEDFIIEDGKEGYIAMFKSEFILKVSAKVAEVLSVERPEVKILGQEEDDDLPEGYYKCKVGKTLFAVDTTYKAGSCLNINCILLSVSQEELKLYNDNNINNEIIERRKQLVNKIKADRTKYDATMKIMERSCVYDVAKLEKTNQETIKQGVVDLNKLKSEIAELKEEIKLDMNKLEEVEESKQLKYYTKLIQYFAETFGIKNDGTISNMIREIKFHCEKQIKIANNQLAHAEKVDELFKPNCVRIVHEEEKTPTSNTKTQRSNHSIGL